MTIRSGYCTSSPVRHVFAALFCLALAVIQCANAQAAAPGGDMPALTAPGQVARGDAFAARASIPHPTTSFSFFWRGKRYRVAAEEQASDGGTPVWSAQILLPVPLDEQARTLELGVCASADCARAERQATVRLADRKRPVQRLTVNKNYVTPPPEVRERIRNDREKVRAALAQPLPQRHWSLPLERPVPGTVSSLFGLKRIFNGQPRGVHRGLDLRGAQGTPIRACADGVVALADNLYFSGNAVYINHGDGVFTSYLHMSETHVKPGQRVRRGDVLGLVGATGRVTGPHLHLGLTVQGEAVDPQPLLASPVTAATAPGSRKGQQ